MCAFFYRDSTDGISDQFTEYKTIRDKVVYWEKKNVESEFEVVRIYRALFAIDTLNNGVFDYFEFQLPINVKNNEVDTEQLDKILEGIIKLLSPKKQL